jgi:hypothetical protein
VTLPLTLAFVALVLLCTLALVWSHWPAWLKGLLVLATTTLYFFGHQAVHEMWGWPSSDALPERFVLLAAVFDEPDKRSEGALYIWVNGLHEGKPDAQPRAYKLPYSKDLHALLAEGMKKARMGVSQMGTAEPKRGRSGFSWLRPGADEQDLKIRDLPVPQLPEK